MLLFKIVLLLFHIIRSDNRYNQNCHTGHQKCIIYQAEFSVRDFDRYLASGIPGKTFS